MSVVGLVGCGYWGRNLARTFAGLEALGATCDVSREAAREVASRHGSRALVFDEMLSDPTIVGVAIATPPITHAELAERALRAGKDVFVEKPLALTVDEGTRLKEVAADTSRVLMVGHLMRYHPAFIEMQNLVNGGGIGELRYLASHRLNFGRIRTSENILWSFAPHDISMILALTGEAPELVGAFGASYISESIPDVTVTHMEFAKGIRAHIYVSWLHPFKEQRLVAIGTEGTLLLDDTQPWASKLRLYENRVVWGAAGPASDRGREVVVPVEPAEPLELECKHFLDRIADRDAPLTDAEEALRVLRVLQQAQDRLESAEGATA